MPIILGVLIRLVGSSQGLAGPARHQPERQ